MEKTFSYSVVERGLSGTFGVDNARIGQFRGRLQNLRKLGLPPNGPGKGKPFDYHLHDIDALALALQFELIGVPPTAAIKFIKDHEKRLTNLARDARAAARDLCIIIESNPKSSRRFGYGVMQITGPFYLDPSKRKANFPSGDINTLWEFLARGANGHVFNLSDLFRTLDRELAAAQPRPFVASVSRRSLRTNSETIGNIRK